MKSFATLLSFVCIASLGLSGCASQQAKCLPSKNCPVTKQACPGTSCCPTASAGQCPATKKSCTPQ